MQISSCCDRKKIEIYKITTHYLNISQIKRECNGIYLMVKSLCLTRSIDLTPAVTEQGICIKINYQCTRVESILRDN